MTARRIDPPPAQDLESEPEWQLQERALREEREGAAPSDEASLAAYRQVAGALRRPLTDRLPSNFAFQMAQLVARLPRVSRLDLRLEHRLMRVLVAAMVLSGAVAAVAYGRDWLAALEAGAGHGASRWVIAAGACLLLTWAMGGLRRWRSEGRVR